MGRNRRSNNKTCTPSFAPSLSIAEEKNPFRFALFITQVIGLGLSGGPLEDGAPMSSGVGARSAILKFEFLAQSLIF